MKTNIGDLLESAAGALDTAIDKVRAKVSREAHRFLARRFGGHVSIGPITFYGQNAMQWASTAEVESLGVSLVFCPMGEGGWSFYVSPNGAIWAAVLGCGPGFDAARVRARLIAISNAPHAEHEAESLRRTFVSHGPILSAAETAALRSEPNYLGEPCDA